MGLTYLKVSIIKVLESGYFFEFWKEGIVQNHKAVICENVGGTYSFIVQDGLNKKTNIASAHYYFKLGNVYVQKNRYTPQSSFFSNAIQNYDSASYYAELDKNKILLGKIFNIQITKK